MVRQKCADDRRFTKGFRSLVPHDFECHCALGADAQAQVAVQLVVAHGGGFAQRAETPVSDGQITSFARCD
jgi:hypothetical protein